MMHVWRVRAEYKGATNQWHPHTFEVLATTGAEVLETLEARFPLGIRVKEYVQLGDFPRILVEPHD